MSWFSMFKASREEFKRQMEEYVMKDVPISACPICGHPAEFDCSLAKLSAKIYCPDHDYHANGRKIIVKRSYPLDAITSWNMLAELEAYKRSLVEKFSTED